MKKKSTAAVTGVQAASFPFILITLLLDIVQTLRQHQPDKVYIDDQLLPQPPLNTCDCLNYQSNAYIRFLGKVG